MSADLNADVGPRETARRAMADAASLRRELAARYGLDLADRLPAGQPLVVPAGDLLEPARCRALLDRLGPLLGSRSRAITASLLGKRLAFLATGCSLHALSACDQALDVGLDNCWIDCRHDGRRWRSRLVLRRWHTQPAPAAHLRPAWREAAVAALFGGHLLPLWQALSHASGLAPRILWENTAVRVFSLYESRLAAGAAPTAAARIADDWRYLREQAPAHAFGCDHNPLRVYDRHRQGAGGRRKTCCLYYLATRPAEFCRTCPLG